MTLYRCDRCGRGVMAESAPTCCDRPMRAVAQEVRREPRKRCCLGRRRGM